MLNTPEPVRIRSYLERKKERERAQAEAAGHPWNENESLPASPASPLDPTSVFTKQITVSPPTCSSPAPDNLRDEIPTSRYYNPPQQHSSHQLNHRHSTSFSNMHLPAQKMPPVPSYSKPTGPAVSSRRPLPSPGPTAVGRRQSIDVLAKQGADNGLKGRKLSMPYMRESDFLEHMASPFAQQSSSSTNPLVSARPTRSQTVPLRLPAPLPPPTPATSERPLPALRKYRSSFMQSIPEPQESHSIPTYSPSSSSTFHSPVRPNMDHGPIWDPNTAQKHDTINSVKSLDRFGMIPHRTPPDMAWGSVGKRPLPRPPGVVGVSKSLDRGDPVTGHGSGFPNPSRVVTHHRSTGDFQGSTADVLISDVQLPVKGPSGPEIVQTVSISSVQVVTVPSIPTFALEGVSVDEENELAETNKAPSLVISDGPVISVTCSDADELPSISISVPTFNFPDEDDEPASVPLDAATPLVSDITPPVRFPDGRGIFCAKCDLVIIGRILNAMDRRWHPECFKCDTCTTSLEHVSSYEHEGRPYCHMDYHEQFAPRCHYCNTSIIDTRFITIEDATLGLRYYHELHFFCAECGDPFLDPSKSSAAGTEALRNKQSDSIDDDESELTKEFVIHGKHAFCESCHIRLHKPKCRGCKKPIKDAGINAMNQEWHRDCFHCADCDDPFHNNVYFPLEGLPFCQDCFLNLTKM